MMKTKLFNNDNSYGINSNKSLPLQSEIKVSECGNTKVKILFRRHRSTTVVHSRHISAGADRLDINKNGFPGRECIEKVHTFTTVPARLGNQSTNVTSHIVDQENCMDTESFADVHICDNNLHNHLSVRDEIVSTKKKCNMEDIMTFISSNKENHPTTISTDLSSINPLSSAETSSENLSTFTDKQNDTSMVFTPLNIDTVLYNIRSDFAPKNMDMWSTACATTITCPQEPHSFTCHKSLWQSGQNEVLHNKQSQGFQPHARYVRSARTTNVDNMINVPHSFQNTESRYIPPRKLTSYKSASGRELPSPGNLNFERRISHENRPLNAAMERLDNGTFWDDDDSEEETCLPNNINYINHMDISSNCSEIQLVNNNNVLLQEYKSTSQNERHDSDQLYAQARNQKSRERLLIDSPMNNHFLSSSHDHHGTEKSKSLPNSNPSAKVFCVLKTRCFWNKVVIDPLFRNCSEDDARWTVPSFKKGVARGKWGAVDGLYGDAWYVFPKRDYDLYERRDVKLKEEQRRGIWWKGIENEVGPRDELLNE